MKTISRSFCLLLVVCLVLAATGWSAAQGADQVGGPVPPPWRIGLGPAVGNGVAAIQAVGRGLPWLNLTDGVSLPVDYSGPHELVHTLHAGQAEALSVAAGDFDEDGVPDLVSGYARAGGGLLTLHRGNIDAVYPNEPEAQQRRAAGTLTAAPFLAPASTWALPAAPTFLGVGDWNNDGHQDVVAAARGGAALVLVPGDGRGGLDPAEMLPLPGGVTALAVGDVNRRDGLADLAVAVQGSAGANLLVFEGPAGALRAEPELLPLPGEAAGLAVGQMDDEWPIDLAVAVRDGALLVVHGRDRQLGLDEVTIDTFPLPYPAAGLAAGNLIPEQDDYRLELAVLDAAGVVHVLDAAGGAELSRVVAPTPAGGRGYSAWPTRLLAAKVSSLPGDDLLLLDGGRQQIHLLLTDGWELAGFAAQTVTLDVAGEPLAVLPMRLNVDALADLVVLRGGAAAPAVVHTAPLNTYTVVTAGDGGDECAKGNGVCAVTEWQGDPAVCVVVDGCTLRAALEEADSTPGVDYIGFALPGGGGAISLGSYLDAAYPVTLDGTTQSGYAGRPVVEITASPDVGLYSSGGNTVIRGLAFTGAAAHGLQVDNYYGWNAGNTVIEGSYFGLKRDGSQCDGNGGLGVVLGDVANNRVGGTVTAARNVFACNRAHGLQLCTTAAVTLNRVIGNYFGTDAAGTADRGNGGSAVAIADGPNNDVGGATAEERNIIAGNHNSTGSGVAIAYSQAAGNLVMGNYIGVDKDGLALPNTSDGVALLDDAHDNTVGGTAGVTPDQACQGECNWIASNGRHGVYLGLFTGRDAPLPAPRAGRQAQVLMLHAMPGGRSSPGSITGNLVRGNFIGTKLDGRSAYGNAGDGVHLLNTPGNTIGGDTAAAGNLISGNVGRGVYLGGTGTTDNMVQNNYIGSAAGGDARVANQQGGVLIEGGADNTVSTNLISGNIGHGVQIKSSSTPGNRLELNYIGVEASGDYRLGNSEAGVSIENAAGNVLYHNLIGGNTTAGVVIQGSAATGNRVQANWIGTDEEGLIDLANGLWGVAIQDGALGNVVGGPESGDGNVIAFENKAVIVQDASLENGILGNSIYSNREIGIDLGNDYWTVNDTGDGDTGPNNKQNFPAITAVTIAGNTTIISGTLRSQPNADYWIEFFASPKCERSLLIQGKTFLGHIEVRTNVTGTATFGPVSFPGKFPVVTATATDMDGNTSEFSPPDVRVSGVEVNQSVGNLNNDITMVVNKDTLVRVFVRSAVCDVSGVRGRLTRQLTGDAQPLTPQNGGITATRELGRRPTSAERKSLEKSINFILPDGWIWHEKTWKLYADVNPDCLVPDADCDPDPGDTDNNLAVTAVKFEYEPPLNLVLLNLKWYAWPWPFGTAHMASPADGQAIVERLAAMYPIPRVDVYPINAQWCCALTEDPDIFSYLRVNIWLANIRYSDIQEKSVPPDTLYYALLGDADSGQGHPTDPVASGGNLCGPVHAAFNATHELGHAFRMWHICTTSGGEPWCGPGPYPDPSISPTTDAFLGTTVYGYDFAETRPGQTPEGPGTNENMTYPGLCGGENRWLSRWSWDKIRGKHPIGGGSRAGALAAADESILVSGMISLTQGVAILDPIYRLSGSPAVPLPEPGDFALELFAGNTLLATYPFTAPVNMHIPPEYGEFSSFSLLVPYVSGATRLEVTHGEQVLATRGASPAAPTVDVTYPQGGEVLTGTVTVTWAAGDHDGDDLSYMLQYSDDDGQTWQVVALNWPGTSLELDTTTLPGSSQARLRVRASDGWNSTVAATDAFQVETKAPYAVAILTPADGQIYTPGEGVRLHGSAWDAEDGVLTGTLLVWTDSIGGVLGSGETLYTTTLAAGLHTITLTATDSDGQTGTASITLLVSEFENRVALPLVVRRWAPAKDR